MIKSIAIVVICFLLSGVADAQKRDTVVYYLKNDGKVVNSKDSADFFLVILPPDTSVDKNLFVVNEFYRNGKTRLMGNSKTNTLDLKFQGAQVSYFPNGHKMRFETFENGEPVGNVIEYYPNGKLYNIKSYTSENKLLLNQFNDSTGTILAEHGKGKWKEFASNFKTINAEGDVNKGLEDGIWIGKINDSVSFESTFKDGKLLASETFHTYKDDNSKIDKDVFTKVDKVPEFPGGLQAFGVFLVHALRYPESARKNNTQGRLIISFTVEKDGTLTDIKVRRGIGDGCDEESVRVLKLSPPWKPGMQNGKPVRVAYSIPISFTIAN